MKKVPFGMHPVVRENIVRRLAQQVGELPPEGVPRAAFAQKYLCDVDVLQTDQFCAWLAQRHIIRIKTRRGVPYVTRPSSRPGRPKAPALPFSDATLKLLRKIVPEIASFAALAPQATHGSMGERAVRHTMSLEAISALERIVTASGVPVDDVVAAMQLVYPEALARIHGLRRDFLRPSEAPRRKRIANGLDFGDRLLEIIARSGGNGVTVSDIRDALPQPLRPHVAGILEDLVTCDLVNTVDCRSPKTKRLATRYFRAPIMPRLDSSKMIIREY